jgi:hypothetical protein
MAAEILSAIILAAASLVTSLLTFIHGRRSLTQQSAQWKAEIEKLAAEAEKLRAETDALREKPLEMERNAYQDLLTMFLNPFRDLLTQNQRIYDGLLEGRGALEYHPRSLARFFNSLPDNDKRKLHWYQRIERLRKNNRRILALIQQYGGRIVTENFRDACAEFRYHADEWEDVWQAVEYTLIPLGEEEAVVGDPIPGDKIVGEGETLYANRFPASLQPALDEELNEVRRLSSRTSSKEKESGL